jgi:exosortase/archaeosortase family protein
MGGRRDLRKGSGRFLRRHGPVLRAGVTFIGLLVLLLLLYVRLEEAGYLRGIDTSTARATSFLANLFGGGSQAVGTVVRSADMEMAIGSDCTPLVPIIILMCALVAYPSPVRRIGVGIAIGAPLLWALNLVRTTSLFLIGAARPGLFDTAHYLIWQPLMILAAIIVWLVWVERYASAA